MAARRLSVLQVLPALDGGGVERGTLEVAAALVAAGHRSTVLSAGGALVAALERAGSEHLCWPIGRKSPWTLRLVPRLREWLRRHPVDVVHVRSRLPAWIVELALRGMPAASRPRRASTVHGLYTVGRYSAVMCRADRVIAVSGTVDRYLREHYPGLAPARIRVIPRGIRPEEFPFGYRPAADWWERWYRSFPQLRERQVLTLPGRLTRLKGHHDFLDLVGRLRAADLPVHGLVVGGEDPRRRRYARGLRRRVRELGLQAHVTFTGQRSDMREIYAASALVLSLSRRPESFGRTTLEALSIGTPVVGYDHGGVGEVLGELYPAGRVPPGALELLAARAGECCRRPARPAPQRRYLLADMLERTLAVYGEIRA